MSEKLNEEVREIVDAIFAAKKEEEKKLATETALTESAECVKELTDNLEIKNSEIEEKAEQLTKSEAQIEELKSELEAAKTEIEDTKTKLATAEETIEGMEKDKAADERMSELEQDGILGTDSEAIRAKVREMSAEDFDAYKQERIDLKESVIAQLKASTEEKAGEEEASTDDEDKTTATEDTTTDPAQVDADKVALAALNADDGKEETIEDKYSKLGKALAAKITKGK